MGRIAARRAKQMRDEWAESLGGTVRRGPPPSQEDVAGRGLDYSEADSRWVCNRKKAYGSKWMADKVAARLNAANETEDAREGFRGVHVVAYQCRRCGEYHIGR